MAATLTLYTNPMSRGRMARWMLEEVGAPYETRVTPYGPPLTTDAFRAINPMAKLPALTHGDAIVTETAAIIAYLADAFPDAGLAPPPAERAAYYRWLFFAAGPIEAALGDAGMKVAPTPEQSRMVGYGDFGRVQDVLERAVSAGDYVAGERFTAADVYVGGHIGFGLQFGLFEKRDAFMAYDARMKARPALQRATALDDADAAETAKKD